MSLRRLSRGTHTLGREPARWGLARARRDHPRATRAERRWRWPTLLALLATVPAFYAELLQAAPSALASAAYVLAAIVLAAGLAHVSHGSPNPRAHVLANPTVLLLIAGLIASALLPASSASNAALGVRLGVSFLTLLRMVWTIQHLITRGGLSYLLMVSVLVLGACGLGFWWLEPTTPDLPSGLWLAFTTAATVGYGDVVPTTPAAKIFAVFVVLLGYGVLTLATAAIATRWVETGERLIEREILHDMRREMAALRSELIALRESLPEAQEAQRPSKGQPVRLDVEQAVEDQ